MVEVSDLFVGGLVPHKCYGRYVHLWVWPWQTLVAASADEPLCLLLPFLGSMQEHIMEDGGLVWPLYLPSGTHIQEQLSIHVPFCLPH